jgi:hypothetical protein
LVDRLMADSDADEAHRLARQLGIGYLWLDEDDPPGAGDRLMQAPHLFRLVFRRQQVRILAVVTP